MIKVEVTRENGQVLSYEGDSVLLLSQDNKRELTEGVFTGTLSIATIMCVLSSAASSIGDTLGKRLRECDAPKGVINATTLAATKILTGEFAKALSAAMNGEED